MYSSENIHEIFNQDHTTVRFEEDFKIIGPVKLPIKVNTRDKGLMHAFLFSKDNENYVACIFGDIKKAAEVKIRISSACIFGFIFNSLLCDCRSQYEESIQKMIYSRAGILIFCLDQHGKGVGVDAHFLVYAEGQHRNMGLFSEIYEELGLKQDYRDYSDVFNIIKILQNEHQFDRISFLTESPHKIDYFSKACDKENIPYGFTNFNTEKTSENSSELNEKIMMGYNLNQKAKEELLVE